MSLSRTLAFIMTINSSPQPSPMDERRLYVMQFELTTTLFRHWEQSLIFAVEMYGSYVDVTDFFFSRNFFFVLDTPEKYKRLSTLDDRRFR